MQDILLKYPDRRGDTWQLGSFGKSNAWTEDRMKITVHSAISLQIQFSDGRGKRIIYLKKSAGNQTAGGITDLLVIGSNVQHGS